MLIRDESVWRSGVARFIDVALGIIIALAVSILLAVACSA